MNRRKLLSIGLVGVMLLVAGCTGPGSSQGDNVTEAGETNSSLGDGAVTETTADDDFGSDDGMSDSETTEESEFGDSNETTTNSTYGDDETTTNSTYGDDETTTNSSSP